MEGRTGERGGSEGGAEHEEEEEGEDDDEEDGEEDDEEMRTRRKRRGVQPDGRCAKHCHSWLPRPRVPRQVTDRGHSTCLP